VALLLMPILCGALTVRAIFLRLLGPNPLIVDLILGGCLLSVAVLILNALVAVSLEVAKGYLPSSHRMVTMVCLYILGASYLYFQALVRLSSYMLSWSSQ
jgi:hypothetical protein